jgi:hypothetical protein
MPLLKSTLEKTALAAMTAGELVPHLPYDGLIPVATALAVAPVAFAGFLVTDTGRLLLRELRRRQRLREKRPDSPSLRGTPTSEEIAADGTIQPRTLLVRLRLGSRLADLASTLDNSLRYNTLPNGKKQIASRKGGLKEYLADHRIPVNYSTLQRYRRLAERLRQLLNLDARLPLEWLLPDECPDRPLPPDLAVSYQNARRRLARLLREHRNFSSLSRHVNDKLGIPELLAVRRSARRKAAAARARRVEARGRTLPCQSVVLYDRTVRLEPSRVEATKRALVRFLEERNLPPPLAHLRNKTLHWLGAVGGP